MTAKDGKPCVRCGTSEWNKSSSCKECARRRARRWTQENPELKKEQDAEWQRQNRDRVAQRNRRWKDNHPEQHRRIMRESGKKWSDNNPDKKYLATKKWKRANPERVAIIENNRRARKMEAGGSFTKQEWSDLCARYGNKCLACGKSDVKLAADHVVPLSSGGANTIENIQPLCHSCNSRKRTRTIDYRH